MATKFEPPKSKSYERAEKAENAREEKQHAAAVSEIATTKVREHERKMHKMAKGGMVARGGGAAKKGLKFTRNG